MTGIRGLAAPTVDGCTVLTPTTSTYRDGAEERVYGVIRDATDLSSMSDELAAQATSWAERYHLATSRANLLRPFALSNDAAVLEIGAGCGAITRYLGSAAAESMPWSRSSPGLGPPGPACATSATSRCSSDRSTTCLPNRSMTWWLWWVCSNTSERDRPNSDHSVLSSTRSRVCCGRVALCSSP